jgi:membrane-associated HD superfamily phosphohydrolase
MNKFITTVKELGIPVMALLVPVLASAQVPAAPVSAPTNTGFNNLNNLGTSLCTITNWLFYFLIILTVIFIIIAAFKYLTAGGDPEKVKGASHMLLYAAIAVVVGILAKAVPGLVGSVIGSTITTGC